MTTKPSASPFRGLQQQPPQREPQAFPLRVTAFFRDCPDEQLTADDIATKFDYSRNNVHTQLKKLVDHGTLSRTRDEDGNYVYSAGPKLAQAPAPSAAPQKSRGVNIDSAHAQTAAVQKTKRVPLDWDAIPIETNVPRPRRISGHKTQAAQLLARMSEVGQTFAVPANAAGLHSLRKLVAVELRKTPGCIESATIGDKVRFWRVKGGAAS